MLVWHGLAAGLERPAALGPNSQRPQVRLRFRNVPAGYTSELMREELEECPQRQFRRPDDSFVVENRYMHIP